MSNSNAVIERVRRAIHTAFIADPSGCDHTAYAQAALAALKQHHADHREGQHQVDHQQNATHIRRLSSSGARRPPPARAATAAGRTGRSPRFSMNSTGYVALKGHDC